jgi:subtilisin family serine protease
MRRVYLISFALIFSLLPLAPVKTASARKAPRKGAVKGEVIVKLKAAAEQSSARSFQNQDELMALARNIGEGIGAFQEAPGSEAIEPLISSSSNAQLNDAIAHYGFDRTFVMKFDDNSDLDAILADLRANAAVEYAEPNYRVEPASILPNDPGFNEQWALRNLGLAVGGYPATLESDIKATEAWEITTGSPDVLVAVTDTGLDSTHPDIAPNVYTNPREIPGNGIDDDNNGYVDDVHGFNVADKNNDTSDVAGHGTEMSGIIAAKLNNSIGICGVSQSQVVPVRFFKKTGPNPDNIEATVAGAARSLLYAVAIGAKIINASWSAASPSDEELQTLKDAVSATNDAGALLICIAGNFPNNLDFVKLYPASFRFPNQIVVAATEFNDELWHPPFDPGNIRTGFGRNSVDLGAPGTTILTTAAHGSCLDCNPSSDPSQWYITIDGTSAAAAYVTGAAALVKSYYPNASVVELRRRLVEGVEKRSKLENVVISGGRLSAYGALTIQLNIVAPVLTKLKVKSGGKTFIYGDQLQNHAILIVGSKTYVTKFKNGDLSRLVTNIPQEDFPFGVPTQVKLQNPDGGESNTLTITR